MNITYKWLLRFSLEIISRLDLETVLLESHDLTSGLKLQDFFRKICNTMDIIQVYT